MSTDPKSGFGDTPILGIRDIAGMMEGIGNVHVGTPHGSVGYSRDCIDTHPAFVVATVKFARESWLKVLTPNAKCD